MKTFLVFLVFLMTSSACFAAGVNIGTFGSTTYYLLPESLRVCSTSECFYVYGQDQEYVAAKIQLVRPGSQQRISDDVLSYDRSEGYIEQTVLFRLNGTQFILLETSRYDINGNHLGTENKTVKKETYQSNTATVTRDSKGNETVTRDTQDVYIRTIAWSNVFPGTPGEAITKAVLSYVEQNYAEIDAKSKQSQYIRVGK